MWRQSTIPINKEVHIQYIIIYLVQHGNLRQYFTTNIIKSILAIFKIVKTIASCENFKKM